jgi:hypothetical protein
MARRFPFRRTFVYPDCECPKILGHITLQIKIDKKIADNLGEDPEMAQRSPTCCHLEEPNIVWW